MWYKLFLLLIVVLPFSFALNPTKTIDLAVIRLLIPIVFVFWVFESLFYKKILLDTRPRFIFFSAFLFISAISFFWTLAPSLGLRKAIFLISIAPIYFVSFASMFNKKRRLCAIQVLVWSGFFVSVFAIIQFILQFLIGLNPTLDFIRWYLPFFLGSSFSELVFSFPSWMVNVSGRTIIRTFGTFPDPHIFSLYVNMLIPLSFYLFFLTKKRFFLLSTLSLLFASLLSFSRASYLSLVAGIIFFILSPTGFYFLKKYFKISFFVATAIILIALIPNPLTNRFFSSVDLKEGSNDGRIAMWKVAANGIKEHPWSGIGIGSFPYLINPDAELRNPVYAHNIFLDFGVETGIINMFFLILTILSPVFFYFKKKTPLSLAIATTFIIFLTHSMFETPFFSIQIFPLFCILLATKSDD